MGDWFQCVVDRDVEDDDASASGSAIHSWLVSEGIIDADPTDCVLGKKGYRPGPHYTKAVDDECQQVPDFATNGVEINTTRNVYDSGQGTIVLICRKCHERTDLSDSWGKAVAEWSLKQSPGLLHCPVCRHVDSITEWQHDPPWGFGCLALVFWNWPRLQESFVEAIGRRLGNRIVVVSGKR